MQLKKLKGSIWKKSKKLIGSNVNFLKHIWIDLHNLKEIQGLVWDSHFIEEEISKS